MVAAFSKHFALLQQSKIYIGFSKSSASDLFPFKLQQIDEEHNKTTWQSKFSPTKHSLSTVTTIN